MNLLEGPLPTGIGRRQLQNDRKGMPGHTFLASFLSASFNLPRVRIFNITEKLLSEFPSLGFSFSVADQQVGSVCFSTCLEFTHVSLDFLCIEEEAGSIMCLDPLKMK